MKYRVVIQPQAEADIREAYEWIALDSPAHAERWRQELQKAFESLEVFPKRFAKAREAARYDEDLRQFLHYSHRVIFFVRTNEVHIAHVRHAARREFDPDETS